MASIKTVYAEMYAKSFQNKKAPSKSTAWGTQMAEKERFELSVLAYTRVPGVHLKPLGHLSGIGLLRAGRAAVEPCRMWCLFYPARWFFTTEKVSRSRKKPRQRGSFLSTIRSTLTGGSCLHGVVDDRRLRKKSWRRRLHCSAQTPPVTAKRWFRQPSLPMRYLETIPPALGSAAP